MKRAIFIAFALLFPTLGPVLAQGLGTDDTRTSNNRFKGPIPWADASANGATCNGVADDATALTNAWNSISATGNLFKIDDNCNLVSPPTFSTPTYGMTLQLRGRLLTGGTFFSPSYTTIIGDGPQRSNFAFFQFKPAATIVPASSSISPVFDFSNKVSPTMRNVSLGGNFTGIGFNATANAELELDNVIANSSSNTAQPLVVTGGFGLKLYNSDFSPGSASTNPCILLQDNASGSPDSIRNVVMKYPFCDYQGMLWTSSGSATYGAPSDGLALEDYLFENSNGTGKKDAVTVDTTYNGKQNLYLLRTYVADQAAGVCLLNTGPNASGNNRLATVEIILPVQGACINGTENILNLWAHVSSHLGQLFPNGAPSWTGAILADGLLNVTGLVNVSGTSLGTWTDDVGSQNFRCPNDPTTGTSSGRLVVLTSAGNCKTAAGTDTNDGIIGVCASAQANNCGTSGAAVITGLGPVVCIGDAGPAPTAGNYIKGNSTGTAGECSDTGVSSIGNPPPSTGHIIGVSSGALYNGSGQSWIVLPLYGVFGAVQSGAMPLSGVTGSIGGSALMAGHCASGTLTIANATTSMTVSVSPNMYPGDGFIPWGYVSAKGIVTVKLCAQASGTPTASTYNVRVIQ